MTKGGKGENNWAGTFCGWAEEKEDEKTNVQQTGGQGASGERCGVV